MLSLLFTLNLILATIISQSVAAPINTEESIAVTAAVAASTSLATATALTTTLATTSYTANNLAGYITYTDSVVLSQQTFISNSVQNLIGVQSKYAASASSAYSVYTKSRAIESSLNSGKTTATAVTTSKVAVSSSKAKHSGSDTGSVSFTASLETSSATGESLATNLRPMESKYLILPLITFTSFVLGIFIEVI